MLIIAVQKDCLTAINNYYAKIKNETNVDASTGWWALSE